MYRVTAYYVLIVGLPLVSLVVYLKLYPSQAEGVMQSIICVVLIIWGLEVLSKLRAIKTSLDDIGRNLKK